MRGGPAGLGAAVHLGGSGCPPARWIVPAPPPPRPSRGETFLLQRNCSGVGQAPFKSQPTRESCRGVVQGNRAKTGGRDKSRKLKPFKVIIITQTTR